jgi:radical SAM protein with 4Fe4S-binding SPASM domain
MMVPSAPQICVWEVTLACNAACMHCGSWAGAARPDELSTAEALAACAAMAELGVREVTLSGGEPLLRGDWEQIVAALRGRGLVVEMISNGLALDEGKAARIAKSGIRSVSLSVDGDAPVHDRLRGVPGAFGRVMAAARALRAEGIRVGAVTQVCRPNLDLLPAIESALRDGGFGAWQLQLTMPIGRCGRDLAIDPSQVRRVIDFITDDSRPDRLPRYGADNIGWMLACEPALRSVVRPTDRAFCGCQAGLHVMGLTSDGTVRGCLSMPPVFDEGNLRQRSLREIWQNENGFAYNRHFTPEKATGPCRDCGFVRLCRGGCKTLAHAAGRGLGENPYCVRIAAQEGADSS